MHRRLFILAINSMAFLGLSGGCFSPVSPDGNAAASSKVSRCLTPEQSEVLAEQVLELVNLERAELGLPPVAADTQLRSMAETYACRMVTEKFFGHRDPVTGHRVAQRAVNARYTFFAVGENLAAGAETPAEVMKLWMNSPTHRAIILDPIWRELGVGVRSDGEQSMYWVQEFGDPAKF